MAWSSGEYITASKLNSENSKVTFWLPEQGNNTTGYYPSSNGFYCHSNSGVIFRYTVGNGWFTSPKMYIEKYWNGSWHEVYYNSNGSWGSRWGDTVYMSSLSVGGVGWYRIKFVSSWSGTKDWQIYPYQKDCKRGDYLVCYDVYTNSGNRIPKVDITASLLNTGRIGTVNVL